MHPINQNKNVGYWELDYDWSKRGGEWNEFTDVMLFGEIEDDECASSALAEWVSLQGGDFAVLDGERREIFYAGGVQGYLESTARSTTIYLHSSGEDAFDSLSHYSKEIARFL